MKIELRPWSRGIALTVLCLVALAAQPLRAATLPAGFTETVIAGPWEDAVGTAFENNGRLYVWERSGRVWFRDAGEAGFSLLLDIRPEVGAWQDHGLLGFALDPDFRVNGRIYLLYVVDRHHLLNFGLPSYDPGANQYDAATIGRLTRYTCTASNDFRSVDLGSRTILIGETKQTGIPILSETHGVGSLAFGTDGMLLVACGDGASPYGVDQGGVVLGSHAPQGLSDGIIRTKENVGALRSQLVDCLNGKVLRLDPATGEGAPSNPYYDAANPRAPRSRVWALGLRNPYQVEPRFQSGSPFPAAGQPGVLYIGDVGWNDWECVRVVTGPGQNSGWPFFEGLSVTPGYDGDVANQDAPNPLYPAAGCDPYFRFSDLLQEDSLAAAAQPPFVNPCDIAQRIPGSIPQFLHHRPVLDWNHASAITRTPVYGPAGQAWTTNVGAPGSPVSGAPFRGSCAIGGTRYRGTAFPAQYQDKYFFADWGQGSIYTLAFDANDRPTALATFATNAGAVVNLVQHPVDGSLYCVSYNFDGGSVRRLAYTGNRPPVAVASADQHYGPTPLAVQFSSAGSGDPDGQAITYSWNFGDGSPAGTGASPSHNFSAPIGVPTQFVVTLTVTDTGGLSAQKNLIVAVNDTPPAVAITSPATGSLCSPSNTTPFNLSAAVSDTESGDAQLKYQWQVFLHHNDRPEQSLQLDTNHVTTALLEPTGCDGASIYFYRIVLTVTDPTGLATAREVTVHPDCGPNTPPSISSLTNQSILQNHSTGPIPFTVGDAEAAEANLQVSASSSNPTLVPAGNIVFGGGGSNRTLTVTPVPGLTGDAIITVTVNDGPNNTTANFLLTVSPSLTLTSSFTNASPISIPSQGAATPYPSALNVTGMSGTISNVTVTLRGLSHAWPDDLDVLLVGPGGQMMTLMSDAGTGTPANDVTLTFADPAAVKLPQVGPLASGTFRPADYAPADSYPAPAPGGTPGTALAVFNGLAANGGWSLYVFDDGSGDSGSMAGGWSLTITTASVPTQPPTISDIPGQTTAMNTPTPGIAFTINDPDTAATSLTLSGSSSNPALVATGNIVFGGAGTNRTVTVTPTAGQQGIATITVTVSDGANSASDTFVLTVVSGEIAGVVRDQATLQPIAGALVSLQTTSIRTNTGPDGRYALPISSGSGLVIVAAHKGHYNLATTVTAPSTNTDFLLEAVPFDQNPNYQLVSPQTCSICHPDQQQQWENTPMAKAGVNTWVHDLFSGKGTTGGLGGFVYVRDSKVAASNPASECASCHQPELWIKDPFTAMRDPTLPPTDSVLHGVSCEVCHKVANVDVEKINYPGIFPGAVDFTRPTNNSHQVQYGVLGDASFNSTIMRPSFQPQLVAEVCGACHQDATDVLENHTFSGPISEPTYLEWRDSPYGNPASPSYASCVDCHMPPSGSPFACDFQPMPRDTNTIRSHTILGTTPAFLENAAALTLQSGIENGSLRVNVTVTNSLTGHHVPTGVTIRNLILLIEAWREADGLPLAHTGSQTVHSLGGVGDPAQGYYAGQPGKLYAKVSRDDENHLAVFFTEATGIEFDTRIPAFGQDATSYTFAPPPGGGSVRVRARLIYRRSFRPVVDIKGWTQDGHGQPLEDLLPPHFGHLMESAEQTLLLPPSATARLSLTTNVWPGPVTLRVEGLSFQQYVVEASQDLDSWTPLGTVQPVNGVAYFTDSAATNQLRRFYRARNSP